MALAKISWSNNRYEMIIDGKLKAHTKDGINQDQHEAGREYMEGLAKEKGYEIFSLKKK